MRGSADAPSIPRVDFLLPALLYCPLPIEGLCIAFTDVVRNMWILASLCRRDLKGRLDCGVLAYELSVHMQFLGEVDC